MTFKFFITCLSLFFSSVASGGYQKLPHSQARLVANTNGLFPGGRALIALHIKLEKGWHTYWQNPGDTGAAPILKFTAMENASVSARPLPIPTRFEDGNFISFGYKDEVWFPAGVEINDSWQVGQKVRFQLSAEYLVCKESCIPAKANFEISLPVLEKENVEKKAFPESYFKFSRVSKKQKTYRLKKVGERFEVTGDSAGAWSFVDFFPITNGLTLRKPAYEKSGEGVRIFLRADPNSSLPVQEISGLMVVSDLKGRLYGAPLVARFTGSDLWRWLFLAFIGGMILNLMPCVFPVLSIKVFSLLQSNRHEFKKVRRHALLYALGVLSSLWLLAGILALLRLGGEKLGWGFQLQSPTFVAFLCILFSVMAFSFLGWLTWRWGSSSTLEKLSSLGGASGDFFSGVLATVVATPCTAPFLGAAMGFAFSRPIPQMFGIFSAVGLGLAAPYVVLSFSFSLQRILPRPGRWMERLKKAMAFPLFATSLWLLWLLARIASPLYATIVLGIVVLLGVIFWLRQPFSAKKPASHVAILLLGASLCVLGAHELFKLALSEETVTASIKWEKYSPEEVAKARQNGEPVFVDFTASWCLTCQVNKKTTFTQVVVEEFIKKNKIRVFRADWTKPDPVITQTLEEYGRIGVPFYPYWGPGSEEARILPEVLTPTIFMRYLEDGLSKEKP